MFFIPLKNHLGMKAPGAHQRYGIGMNLKSGMRAFHSRQSALVVFQGIAVIGRSQRALGHKFCNIFFGAFVFLLSANGDHYLLLHCVLLFPC